MRLGVWVAGWGRRKRKGKGTEAASMDLATAEKWLVCKTLKPQVSIGLGIGDG